MPYAAMVVIGVGNSKTEDAEETASWHEEHGLWLSNHEADLPVGTPVVARMAGPSNALDWQYELPIAWPRHVVRGLRGRDLLPESRALARSSHVELVRGEWGAIQAAHLLRAS